jgi:hypothetical protein
MSLNVIEPDDDRLPIKFVQVQQNKVGRFIDLLSPFPSHVTARRIQNKKIADAYFDVGPDGIISYFKAMAAAKVSIIRWMLNAVLWFALGCTINAISEWNRDFGGPGSVIEHMASGTLFITLFCLAAMGWQMGTAKAYKEEWQLLERDGLFWRYENGGFFRYTMIRHDSTYQIDPTSRDARVKADIDGVRKRAETKQKSVTTILLTIAGSTASYFGVVEAIRTLHLLDVFLLHLHWLAPLALTWRFLPAPVQQWYEAHLTQRAYERGSQFIPGARVSDPLPEQLTRETVEDYSPHGDAQFATPDDASRGLAG